jgi:hypothetical protein
MPSESPKPGIPPDLPEAQLNQLRNARVSDCNGNAIPDSIDIAEGYAQDVNHNSVIDDCDPDEAVASAARSERPWWRYSDSQDSSYFSVHHSTIPRIIIRYTVPPSGALVLLAVYDSNGHNLGMLVNHFQDNGPYTIAWDRKLAGIPLKPGIYTFRLSVGRRAMERKMAWRNL